MKRYLLLTMCTLCLSWAALNAQTLMKIDGGMLVVEPGATLFVEGGIENVNNATIQNQGLIELEGDFLNDATSTYDNTDPNTLRFSGAAGSDVTSNGAVFNVVEIDKDNGQNVTLQDQMAINGSLDFVSNNNKVITGNNNLVIQDTGAITGYDVNDYVQTDGTGFLRKMNVEPNDVFTFPVGADGSTYNPATLTANGGHTADNFNVRALPAPLEDGTMGAPILNAVDAMWVIDEDAATGSDVNVTLEWAESDENGTFDRTLSGVSRYDGADWDLEFVDADMADPAGAARWSQTRANTSEFSPFTVGGASVAHTLTVPIKVFLQGTYTGAAPQMRDDLRTGAYIPSAEPYAGMGLMSEGFINSETSSDFDQPADGDDIVDWLWVELRDAATPATVYATRSALLQRDGDVVDTNGVDPVAFKGLNDGNYHIAVRHRNHLGIRTRNAQALSGASGVFDFTSDSSQVYRNNAIPNDHVVHLGGGVFGMWKGDANANGVVNYNGGSNDKNVILGVVGILTPNNIVGGYLQTDVNMDGDTKYNGGANDKNEILGVVGILTPNSFITEHLD